MWHPEFPVYRFMRINEMKGTRENTNLNEVPFLIP
jgi:hypothetical protein